MNNDHRIELSRLKECLEYNQLTGELLWKNRPLSHFCNSRVCNSWNAKHAGKIAGNIKHAGEDRTQYIAVKIDRITFSAHRLIYAIVKGEWPDLVIDHIDGNGTNNRWSNLRVCSQKENMQNLVVRKNNKTRITGIHWHKAFSGWAVCRKGFRNLYIRDFFEACCIRKAWELETDFKVRPRLTA